MLDNEGNIQVIINIEVRVVVLDNEGNIQVIINIEVRVVVLDNEGNIQVIIKISCMGSEIQHQFFQFWLYFSAVNCLICDETFSNRPQTQ